jgi:hypothetical protein
VLAAVSAAMCGTAVAILIGTTSLSALAGIQSAFGPAAALGPPAAAMSALGAALALLLVNRRPWAAVPFGLAAGTIACGPAPRTPGDLAVRGAAAAFGIALAGARARWLPAWVSWVGAGVGAAAVVLALVAV